MTPSWSKNGLLSAASFVFRNHRAEFATLYLLLCAITLKVLPVEFGKIFFSSLKGTKYVLTRLCHDFDVEFIRLFYVNKIC